VKIVIPYTAHGNAFAGEINGARGAAALRASTP